MTRKATYTCECSGAKCTLELDDEYYAPLCPISREADWKVSVLELGVATFDHRATETAAETENEADHNSTKPVYSFDVIKGFNVLQFAEYIARKVDLGNNFTVWEVPIGFAASDGHAIWSSYPDKEDAVEACVRFLQTAYNR